MSNKSAVLTYSMELRDFNALGERYRFEMISLETLTH